MAQIVRIPLAFEFRPLRAKWSARSVEIQGWTREFSKRGLFRSIDTSDNVKVEIFESEKPGGLEELYGMLGPIRASELKNSAVIHWKDIPVEVKAASTPAKSMEEIRYRTFNVLVCESRQGDYPKTGDAWAMRREFLSLKQNDPLALLGFLRRWGVWDEKRLGLSNIENVVFPERIWELQATYREALVGPADEWLSKGVDPFKGAYATPMYPHFILDHCYCKLAIEATITIDLLRKVRFRKCKRPDCREVFQLESRHKRLYCGQPCAHLESVRKQRRQAARQKKRSRPRKGE